MNEYFSGMKVQTVFDFTLVNFLGSTFANMMQLTSFLATLNHATVSLPTFICLYFICLTQPNKTLDLRYGNIPDANKSVSHPPLETSDYNTTYFIPAYRPKIKTEQVLKKDVKV